MAYIYKITNKINNKVYIGKTYETIEKRWKNHIKDSKRSSEQHRPLYRAFNKYGIENFIIEEIEETSAPEEREKYWIEKYGSFHQGYNATIGGDGRPYIDYDLVVKTYQEAGFENQTAHILNIDTSTVRKILKEKQIPIIKNVGNSKKVAQYSLKGELLESFLSAAEAGRKIIQEKKSIANCNTVGNRIRECCNGQRKTAYGYKWKFLE